MRKAKGSLRTKVVRLEGGGEFEKLFRRQNQQDLLNV